MRPEDSLYGKPVFYRRRHGVTTIWGNGVISPAGLTNIGILTILTLPVTYAAIAMCMDVRLQADLRHLFSGVFNAGQLGLLVVLAFGLIAAYLLMYWLRSLGLLIAAALTFSGRRLLIFNSRRLWCRGLTSRFGLPWMRVELRFNPRKRYTTVLQSPYGISITGLKTKIFTDAGRKKFLREWDVWLANGTDLQTMIAYALWLYARRTGDIRCRPVTLVDCNAVPPNPYPENSSGKSLR